MQSVGGDEDVMLDLGDLAGGAHGLTPAMGEMLIEAAAVCLDGNKHNEPVELRVFGFGEPVKATLSWTRPTGQQKRSYADQLEAVEWGACAVAVLLLDKFEGLTVVERSWRTTGFDYWLGRRDEEPLFRGKARLEVSGILNGDPARVRERTARKLRQLEAGGGSGTGYAAVVNFGPPESHVSKQIPSESS